MGDEFFTMRELADYLKTPYDTIRYWRYQGAGPVGYRVGKQIRFRRDDVETWLKGRRDTAA